MIKLDDRIKKELEPAQIGSLHSTLLTKALNWVDYSRAVMSEYYSQWDDNFEQYEATNPNRVEDDKADEEERPKSQAIPVTFAQVQTWKAFASQLLGQKQKIFEFASKGKEDEKWKNLGEDVLEADMQAEKFIVKRGQFLANIAITGVGVLKSCWHEKRINITLEKDADGVTAFGSEWGTVKVKEDQSIVVRKGNKVEALSPYKFFPDPAVGLTEIQDGRFVASEHEFSRNELKEMEARGEVAGIDHVQRVFPTERWEKRRNVSRLCGYKHDDQKNEIIVVTEVQMKIVPSQFKLSDNKPLGDGSSQMILCVWIANDSRVIKAEIMNYLHGEFTYDVAVFDSEKHRFIRKSIVDLSKELQLTADWFMNSRMESVTRNVESQLIVDPLAVDIEAVRTRQRIIPLKKGVARSGMDRFIKQLNTTDPTANHMRDIEGTVRLLHMSTGINDNMLGQYNSGRRSATESRVVASGASARAVVILQEIWASALSPFANKALKNLRQGLDKDFIKMMVGERENEHVKAFLATPLDIARNNDLFVYDGTTPSEKSFLAQSLQEVFGLVLANPEAAVKLDLSPKLILEKIYELRGLNFKEDVSLTNDPQTLGKLIQEQATALATQYIQQYIAQANGQQQQSNDAGGQSQ